MYTKSFLALDGNGGLNDARKEPESGAAYHAALDSSFRWAHSMKCRGLSTTSKQL